jgi:hypothetical protein
MLKHLNLDEMVGLTSPWVSDAKQRALFLSIPEIAGLHPQLVELQDQLGEAQPVDPPRSPAMKKLLERATAVDFAHDALVRASASAIETDRLEALARKPPDARRAEQAATTSTKLFPSGLSIINASLVAEAGNAERAGKLLAREPELEQYLDEIPVRDGTVLGLVKRWLSAGKQLAKLERERAELAAKEATKPRDSGALTRLRFEWIRLVGLVLGNLEASRAKAEAIEVLRGPVLEASERASKRYVAEAAAGEQATDSGAETEAEPPADGDVDVG